MNSPRNKARGNRPIDRIREGAGRAEIPTGHGNVLSLKVIGDRLYCLAEHGLTSGIMADRVDPDRTNPNIPFIVQRIELAYGAEHPIMQKTVCVAFELIDPTYLPAHVDKNTSLTLAIEIATSLASVTDVVNEMHAHQAETRAKGEAGQLRAGYVPRIANLKGKVHQSLAALRDVEVAIKKMIAQFYPKDAPNDPWDKKLKAALVTKHGAKGGFVEHISLLWRVIDNVADHRHAMIHPDDTKSLVIYDYELQAAGAFVAPTIEIIHPRSPIARHDTAQFLETQTESIAYVYQCLLAYMCDINVQAFNEVFYTYVATLPDGERRNGSKLVWQTDVKEGFPNLAA